MQALADLSWHQSSANAPASSASALIAQLSRLDGEEMPAQEAICREAIAVAYVGVSSPILLSSRALRTLTGILIRSWDRHSRY